MAASLIYALLAILGLGFLVLIHELGHYWIARRQGMRVEAFAIGFGKPIYTWEWQGVKWHICCLPFGGYVRIAGMQKEGSREPYEIPDGFYGKRPWQRIQVALAGPLVNLVFAAVAFFVLWSFGGLNKQFSEYTHRIGWIDPKSTLYDNGVRPGDVIDAYDGRPFTGFKDLLIAGAMSNGKINIQGYKVDYLTKQHTPFNYSLPTYDDPQIREKIGTIGVLSPARYMIYDGPNALPAGSPMIESGIQPKDRILWADGELVFSAPQLSALTNESTAFITVQRGDQVFQTKVPRVVLDDLKMTASEKGEFDDWQHEAELRGRLQDLYFIPYNLSPTVDVESRLNFIEEEEGAKAFQQCSRCSYFHPLEEGDKILAVDGYTVQSSYELLKLLQTRRVLVIVDRNPASLNKVLWTQADDQFDQFSSSDLQTIISSIGTSEMTNSAGTFHLLNPIVPKPLVDLALTTEQKAQLAQELAQSKKEIAAIQDPEKRYEELKKLEQTQHKAVLGVPLKDREVFYNPSPQQQFLDVFKETWRTLYGLVSGYLNPKFVSGPVGIVQVVHHSWMLGPKEALYWMAVISLNLGLINLLPIPVLDGGHIMFSVIEMITKRPLRSKTMERLIIPFVGLLIALFIYITYQDIARLFSKFF